MYFQTDFQDVNTDKAASMYKNVVNMEFKITSVEVFFFLLISLSNFACKCFDYGKEVLVGTKLKIFCVRRHHNTALLRHSLSKLLICLPLRSLSSMRVGINFVLLTILLPMCSMVRDK